jgi:hypothetical protein
MSTDTHTKRIELPPELQGIDYLTDEMLAPFFTEEEREQFWHQQLQDLFDELYGDLEPPLTEEEIAEAGREMGLE